MKWIAFALVFGVIATPAFAQENWGGQEVRRYTEVYRPTGSTPGGVNVQPTIPRGRSDLTVTFQCNTLGSPGSANACIETGSTLLPGSVVNEAFATISLSAFARYSTVADLSARVDTEAGRITALDTGLTNEVARATNAEAQLGMRITFESTRAQNAEAALANAIQAETTRAMTAESHLQAQIADEFRARVADVAMLTQQYRSATATAVALSGMSFIPGKRMNVTMNVGAYEGESAMAIQGAFALNDNVYVNLGVSRGSSGGGTATRAGFTFGW